MTVYGICKRYIDNNIEYYVMPYNLEGSIPWLGKRRWWYRSKKKAERIAKNKNSMMRGEDKALHTENKNVCSDCKHLNVINREPIYAYCTANDWTFKLWDIDTRETVCSKFEK